MHATHKNNGIAFSASWSIQHVMRACPLWWCLRSTRNKRSAAKNSAMLNGRPIDRSLKTPRPRHSASEDPRRDHQDIRAAQSKFFRRRVFRCQRNDHGLVVGRISLRSHRDHTDRKGKSRTIGHLWALLCSVPPASPYRHMVNQSLIAIERAAFAPRHLPQAFLSAYSPNQHIVTFIHDGARDEQVGTEDQKQYEIPSNFSVHDFVRPMCRQPFLRRPPARRRS